MNAFNLFWEIIKMYADYYDAGNTLHNVIVFV